MSPPPAKPHFAAVTRLRRLLERQAPDDLVIGENAGITMANGRTVRVPDLIVTSESALAGPAPTFLPDEILLAVEVMSPDSGGDDLIMKRHQYGLAGIPHYWIVDQKSRVLRVLRHDGRDGYLDHATVTVGETWHTADPFPLSLDPDAFL